jgi:hypothetical protein
MKMGLKYVVSAGSETKTSVHLRWARRTTKAQRKEPQPQSDLPESPSPDHHVSRKENTRIVRVQDTTKEILAKPLLLPGFDAKSACAQHTWNCCNLLFMSLTARAQ